MYRRIICRDARPDCFPESAGSLCEAPDRCFRRIHGPCLRGLYDSLRQTPDRTEGRAKADLREINNSESNDKGTSFEGTTITFPFLITFAT